MCSFSTFKDEKLELIVPLLNFIIKLRYLIVFFMLYHVFFMFCINFVLRICKSPSGRCNVGDSLLTAYVNVKLKISLNNFFIMVIARLSILIYLVVPHFFVSLSRFNCAVPSARRLLRSSM